MGVPPSAELDEGIGFVARLKFVGASVVGRKARPIRVLVAGPAVKISIGMAAIEKANGPHEYEGIAGIGIALDSLRYPITLKNQSIFFPSLWRNAGFGFCHVELA